MAPKYEPQTSTGLHPVCIAEITKRIFALSGLHKAAGGLTWTGRMVPRGSHLCAAAVFQHYRRLSQSCISFSGLMSQGFQGAQIPRFSGGSHFSSHGSCCGSAGLDRVPAERQGICDQSHLDQSHLESAGPSGLEMWLILRPMGSQGHDRSVDIWSVLRQV
jgi:hypothetical protein